MTHLRIADLVTIASRMTGVPEVNIKGQDRLLPFVLIRHAIWSVAREWGYSYQSIASATGRKDHTTVRHSVVSANVYEKKWPELPQFVDTLRETATSLPPFVAESDWAPDVHFLLPHSHASGLVMARLVPSILKAGGFNPAQESSDDSEVPDEEPIEPKLDISLIYENDDDLLSALVAQHYAGQRVA